MASEDQEEEGELVENDDDFDIDEYDIEWVKRRMYRKAIRDSKKRSTRYIA